MFLKGLRIGYWVKVRSIGRQISNPLRDPRISLSGYLPKYPLPCFRLRWLFEWWKCFIIIEVDSSKCLRDDCYCWWNLDLWDKSWVRWWIQRYRILNLKWIQVSYIGWGVLLLMHMSRHVKFGVLCRPST